jgi:hypothetical protein
MTDTTDTLQAAIEDGEVLTVIYHGGSQPGIPRQLAPIQLLPDGKLRARCIATNTAKIFVVSKIQVVDSAQAVPSAYSTLKPAEIGSLSEAIEGPLAAALQTLRDGGFHIEISDEQVSIHKVKQNKQPMKRSAVALLHEPFHMGITWCEDSEDLVEMAFEPRERPWIIHSDGRPAVSFRKLNKAVERFIQLIERLQPTNAPF